VKDVTGLPFTEKAAYVVFSAGADGHGGYTKAGQRLSAGITNTATLDNCNCDSTGAATTWDRSYTQQALREVSATDRFDDHVRYKYRWQLQDWEQAQISQWAGTCTLGIVFDTCDQRRFIETGDFNGDGIPDLLFGAYQDNWTAPCSSKIRTVTMVFGKQHGWPIPPDSFDVNNFDPANLLDGTNGFEIKPPSPLAWHGQLLDVNGDGYADILVRESNGSDMIDYIIFGGPDSQGPWPASLSLAGLDGFTGVNGTSGVKISTAGILDGTRLSHTDWAQPPFTVGDVDGDGHNDLIHIGSITSSPTATQGGYVLFGKPTQGPGDTWENSALINISDLDGTNGFQFYSSAGHLNSAGLAHGQADFDQDGYDDIVISNWYADAFMLYGRSRADWQDALTGSPANTLDLAGEVGATPNRATVVTTTEGFRSTRQSLKLIDVNNDGFTDLFTHGAHTVLYSKPIRRPGSFNLYTSLGPGDGLKYSISDPVWFGGCCSGSTTNFADFNNDGRVDLVRARNLADPLGRTDAGGAIVMLQPQSGWPTVVNSSDYSWDGTDSFYIYGAKSGDKFGDGWSVHGFPTLADLRPGDGSPELIFYAGRGKVVALFPRSKWPAYFDLLELME